MSVVTANHPTQSTAVSLPGPAERPDADVVIYDGHCRICIAQIRQLERMFSGGRLTYLSLHDPEVARLYPDLSYDAMMREMWVVDRQGNRYGGAAALRYLSRRLPRLWWMAVPMHMPGSMPLWSFLYRQVAKRRYQFGRLESCDDGSCRLHQ